jgi:type 2 lantibiotic biosynthesis protein LanM
MYDFVAYRREVFVQLVCEHMAHREVRFIFRPTAFYCLVRENAFQSHFLRHGIDHSLEFRVLERAFLPAEVKPPFWPLLRTETEALENFDIPRLVVRADSAALDDGNGNVVVDFGKSAIEHMEARVRNLSNSDRCTQDSIIRTCFYTVALEDARASDDDVPWPSTGQQTGRLNFRPSILFIAESVAETAIRALDGSFHWLDPVQDAGTSGYHLFEGSAGTALFLAAAARVTGSSRYADLARCAVQPLCEIDLAEASRDGGELAGIGGLMGKGSVVYALVRIAEWLNEPEFVAAADCLANSLSCDEIGRDTRYDVSHGAAGALLGLLALHAVTTREDVLTKARQCGLHLLQGRRESQEGHRAWATIGERFQTGFSHGASGIAYALLRLYAATGDAPFRDAALEGLMWEHTVRDGHTGEWPDFRSDDPEVSPCSWCNGAPGMALARAGGIDLCGLENVEEDLYGALQITRYRPLCAIDQLCCGNWGRVECLFETGRRLGDRELIAEALRLGKSLAGRSAEGRLLRCNPQGLYSAGFYQGIAGIGYQMLRLAAPEALPSVLLWA